MLLRAVVTVAATIVVALTVATIPAFAVAASDSATARYDPEIAMNSFLYARAAYCYRADLLNWSCGSTCEMLNGFKPQGVYHNATAMSQAYTGYHAASKTMIVALRGTVNILNWIYDLDFTLYDYPPCAAEGCKVHHGFLEEWASYGDLILRDYRLIKQAHPNLTSVRVTGHSLGAGVSIIAALELAQIGAPVVLYNFGEPRVGNPQFAAWAAEKGLPQGRQFRVTHADDPIPRVPPLEFGYLHAPHELWYDNDGNTTWTDCNDSAHGEDMSCSAGQLWPEFDDHVHYMGHCVGCVGCTDKPWEATMKHVKTVGRKLLQEHEWFKGMTSGATGRGMKRRTSRNNRRRHPFAGDGGVAAVARGALRVIDAALHDGDQVVEKMADAEAGKPAV
jgi:hypothetical protein